MIIINQERTKVINFEKITEITASGTKILVGDDIFIPKGEEIAKYKTEERAKEVLQEIIKRYSSYLKLEGGPAILQGQMDIQPNIFNIPKVFEMPKE